MHRGFVVPHLCEENSMIHLDPERFQFDGWHGLGCCLLFAFLMVEAR